ncbi:MAG: DUF4352 domain-containing protein [Methanomassiliicoccales archaeon]|nr:MAG: DUF4352 domain-containing protein [Methanomassiliicoccales archaeon]
MRKCSNCGTESGDEAQFCHKCGSTLTVGTYVAPMLYKNYVPPKQKDNTGLIVAVVIVMILAVSMVLAAFFISKAVDDIPWEEWSDLNIEMKVNSQSVYHNPSDLPDEGYKYVRLSVTITNNRGGDLSLEPDHFLLYTSDNQYYGYSTAVPENVPTSLEPGETQTFWIGFMIPEGSVASLLKMDVPEEVFGTVTAVVPS